MSPLLIVLISILLANAYPFAVKYLKINRSLMRFTIAFTLSIITLTCIAVFLSQDQVTNGDMLVISIGLVGVIVRIGADYFRKTQRAVRS